MAVNINSFRVSFTIVDDAGNPIPTLVVGTPSISDIDAKAGANVEVVVPVTNAAGQPSANIIDAVPKWVAGDNVLSSAIIAQAAAINVPAGSTVDVHVIFTVRADAVIGQAGAYDVDLVAA